MAAELGKLSEARAWFEEGTSSNDGKSSCALWHAWAVMESQIGDASAVRWVCVVMSQYKKPLRVQGTLSLSIGHVCYVILLSGC